MTLQNLYFFNEIVKDMNLCVTAERLFISQQALSGHIKRLESHFGVKLFERKPNLVLTKEGQSLKREAAVILAAESRLFSEYGVGLQKKHGTLRIACGLGRSKYYLPGVLSKFSAMYPLVALSCEDENRFRNSNMFETGEIDLAIGRRLMELPGIKHEPLFKTYSCVVIAESLLREHLRDKADHFIARTANGVELSELPKDIPVTHTGLPGQEHWICDIVPELRLMPRVYINPGNHDMLFALCKEGRAMIVISDLFCRLIMENYSDEQKKGILFLPMLAGGKRIYAYEELSYDPRHAHPQYFYDFITILRQTLEQKNLTLKADDSLQIQLNC